MPAKKAKTDKTTEIFTPTRIADVASPGTLPPASATARPVIVTNRSVMQDPMMLTEPSGSATAVATEEKAKLVIRPLVHDNAGTIAEKLPVQTDQDSDGVIDADANNTEKTDKSANDVQSALVSAPTNSHEETQVPDDSDISDDLNGPHMDKNAAGLQADAKAQDELDQLIDQKTYYLPINSVEKRRNRLVVIFGLLLILILAAAWLNIAMDAGFIEIPGLKPVTHIFSN